MSRIPKSLRLIYERIEARLFAEPAAQRAALAARDRVIENGPPAGSGITIKAWTEWHRFGWLSCPRQPTKTCSKTDCGIGIQCREFRALGLDGIGRPLPKKKRPACGARNRNGSHCKARVVPGKRRCRMHGGLSSGPRTAEGRARIAAAQRMRWRTWRLEKLVQQR